MKRTKDTPNPRSFFDRYHHHVLTALCLSFIAVSFAITGCDISNSDVDEMTEEEKGIETMRQATENYKNVNVAIEDGF